jgi:hypothetical protein
MELTVLTAIIQQAGFTLRHSAGSTWNNKTAMKLMCKDEESEVVLK